MVGVFYGLGLIEGLVGFFEKFIQNGSVFRRKRDANTEGEFMFAGRMEQSLYRLFKGML